MTLSIRASFSLLPLLATLAAAQCQCDQYRCKSSAGDFVYSLEEFLPVEAQSCINNNTAYDFNGGCRYCPSCNGNVCECQSGMECEWFSWLAGGCCITAGILLAGFAVRNLNRWHKKHYRTFPYDDTFKLEDWEENPYISIGLPAAFSVGLTVAGVVVFLSRDLYDVYAADSAP
mmetsp:Transcript_81472/g.143884  ORF Transcript_81472/g.143884 Transcript_81472/m.143884 type:complete len:174 (-) Transcript_81472:69-590(-)|eukprot:CAMPEP_0197658786 /NCGR_PEP_ID=MMETSP1338-20131121/45441_1 /TAXON_ID=43686 ORGANISM="Pelagodinium beii, Strain RCC1491" /NCGR_SAMPLE_ID=MMETSP1338 /ASSEMBLY_ACC=CAM_ASM_000754 /LENGTH=173 /DNA_ID=CAMNT_0043235433 /DNA_START=45 /DNA_END=569 /DNA_ORIENTATION=+